MTRDCLNSWNSSKWSVQKSYWRFIVTRNKYLIETFLNDTDKRITDVQKADWDNLNLLYNKDRIVSGANKDL